LAARYAQMRDEELAHEESYMFGRWQALLGVSACGVDQAPVVDMLSGVQVAADILLAEMKKRGITPRCIATGAKQ
jgi:hypothetical protein